MPSNGPSRAGGSRSAGALTRVTRPALMAAALRFDACRTITSEWSTPYTRPAPGRAPRMVSLADDVAVQGAHGRDPGPRDPVPGPSLGKQRPTDK
jgi:hypothetical protein